MCASNALHARVHVFMHVCVQLDVVHGACMPVCAFNYVMITRASQIHDTLVNDTLPVGIII